MLSLIKHIPIEQNINPLYRGCLHFLYELFCTNIEPSFGNGKGDKLSPNDRIDLMLMFNPLVKNKIPDTFEIIISLI